MFMESNVSLQLGDYTVMLIG